MLQSVILSYISIKMLTKAAPSQRDWAESQVFDRRNVLTLMILDRIILSLRFIKLSNENIPFQQAVHRSKNKILKCWALSFHSSPSLESAT
jgi:hypothetical protein